MRTKFWLNLLLFAALAAVAGPDAKPTDAGAAPKRSDAARTVAAQPAADFPVIGYIEKQGRVIAIKSGPKGTIYSVKTTDGKVLYENLSAEQLRAQAPELHEFIKTAVAASGARGDARLRAPKIAASR